jgi:very-short-patch-repair endonuclease
MMGCPKGTKRSEAFKSNLRGNTNAKGHGGTKYWTGKKISDEHRENLSLAHVGKQAGAKNPFYGKKHTKDIIELNREWQNKNSPRRGKKNSIAHNEKIRKAALRQIHPFKDTSIELAMESELKRRGIGYKKQVNINDLCRVDFLLTDRKIVIECDGSFWHKHPFGTEKDRINTLKMQSLGYVVYRFWEQDIHFNVSTLVQRIVREQYLAVA